MEAFQYFKNELPEEWELGDANSGVLTINNTIHALLRILNDIIDFLIERDKINPKINGYKSSFGKGLTLLGPPCVLFWLYK